MKISEVYQGPWHGDPEEFEKSPKTYTMGSEKVRLSDMIQDTINRHGVKWAFEFYVKKHKMPPRMFKILSGI